MNEDDNTIQILQKSLTRATQQNFSILDSNTAYGGKRKTRKRKSTTKKRKTLKKSKIGKKMKKRRTLKKSKK